MLLDPSTSLRMTIAVSVSNKALGINQGRLRERTLRGRTLMIRRERSFVSNKAPGINQGRLREDWLQSKDFAGFSQSGRLVSNKRLVLTRRG